MAELVRLRRILLGMLGPSADSASLADLGDDDWDGIGGIAAVHRLEPLLHSEWNTPERGRLVPERIAKRWEASHRNWGITALAQRADLLATTAHLADADIASVALKGTFLAWHAYPAAAQRPLRDLDLLVPADRAIEAWRVLVEAGYQAPDREPDARDLAEGKHLPPLIADQGSLVELHLRCWEPTEAAQMAMPRPMDERLLKAARPLQPGNRVRFPSPEDMFAHLCIHAAAPYPLDAGPLVLADIDFLVRGHRFDWPALWSRAQDEGWGRMAAYVLAITDRWRWPGILNECYCPFEVPRQAIESAPDLLLLPPNERSATQFMARMGTPGRTLTAKFKGRHPGGFLRWLGSRARRTLGDFSRRETRERARQMRAIAGWLQG